MAGLCETCRHPKPWACSRRDNLEMEECAGHGEWARTIELEAGSVCPECERLRKRIAGVIDGWKDEQCRLREAVKTYGVGDEVAEAYRECIGDLETAIAAEQEAPE